MRLGLKCSDANHICDKSQYKESTLWEKIKLIIHLIHCRACQTYTKNNTSLSKLTNSHKVETMPSSKKNDLKARLAEELAKQKKVDS